MSSSSTDYCALSRGLQYSLLSLNETLKSLTDIEENAKADFDAGLSKYVQVVNSSDRRSNLLMSINQINRVFEESLKQIEHLTYHSNDDLILPQSLEKWREIHTILAVAEAKLALLPRAFECEGGPEFETLTRRFKALCAKQKSLYQEVNGNGAMHYAALKSSSALKAALSQFAPGELNRQNRDGQTPLWFAAHYGLLKTYQRLVAKGADPDIACNRGRIPLCVFKMMKTVKRVNLATYLNAGKYTKDFAAEHSSRRLLAQAFHLRGDSPVIRKDNGEQVAKWNLSHIYSAYLWDKFAKSFAKFGADYPDLLPENLYGPIALRVHATCDRMAYQSVTSIETRFDLLKSKPVIFPSGSRGITIPILIWGDILILSSLDRESMIGYQFDKNRLTIEILKEIESSQERNEEQFMAFFTTLAHRLQLNSTPIAKALAALADNQTGLGGTQYRSHQSFILPLLVLNACDLNALTLEAIQGAVPQQQKIYESWRLYQETRAVEKYLKLCLDPNHTFQPATALLKEAIEKGNRHLNRERVDPRVVAKWEQTINRFNE